MQTDEHYKHVDQGLGHEGVGVIKEIGSLVERMSELRVGDRVGMGVSASLQGLIGSYRIVGRTNKATVDATTLRVLHALSHWLVKPPSPLSGIVPGTVHADGDWGTELMAVRPALQMRKW